MMVYSWSCELCTSKAYNESGVRASILTKSEADCNSPGGDEKQQQTLSDPRRARAHRAGVSGALT